MKENLRKKGYTGGGGGLCCAPCDHICLDTPGGGGHVGVSIRQ